MDDQREVYYESEEVNSINPKNIIGIKKEANFYWNRDNSEWFYVTSPKGNIYGVSNTWGDIKWEGKPRSKKVIDMVEKMVGEDLWTDHPEFPGCIVRTNFPENGSVVDIPDCKGWTITYYENDCEY